MYDDIRNFPIHLSKIRWYKLLFQTVKNISMKNQLIIFLIFFSASNTVSAQSFDGGPGLVYVYAGTTIASFKTSADFNISEQIKDYYPNVSTSVSLENDLSFPSSSDIFYLKAIAGS